MSTDFKQWQAEQITIFFCGLLIDSGYADGEFLSIEQSEKDYTAVVGTDGEVTRCKTNNRHTTITIKLMQTSSGNDKLSALSNLDISVPGGAGVGAFLVRNRLGRSLYTAEKAWIAGPPKVSFDREAQTMEWTLECAYLIRSDGGS